MHPDAYGRGTHLASRRVLSRGGLYAAAVGMISMALYLATLAPGLTSAYDSADGGELATAAYVLGVPHPPGYPTYVLLAHLFTLLPVGEVATRTNLFSAACATGTAVLLAWTLWAYGECRRTSGMAAGLVLASSPLIWSQAIVTEVYALHGFLTAAILVSAIAAGSASQHSEKSARLLMLTVGIAWGISLGNHLTAIFLAPLVLYACWHLKHSWWLGLLGLAIGLLTYLYLPLAAWSSPPINWGNPVSWKRFWWVVSGKIYRPFLFALNWRHVPVRVLAWSHLITQQFGWLGLIGAVWGAMVLGQRNRALFAALCAIVLLCSGFAIAYDTTDSYLYLIPALICMALWLGFGLDWGIKAIQGHKLGAYAANTLILIVPIAVAVWRLPSMDLSGDRAAYEIEAMLLTQAPEGSILISRQDVTTFSLWYFQYAGARRLDVTVLDAGLLQYDWYVAQLPLELAAWDLWDLYQSISPKDVQRLASVLNRPVCDIVNGNPALVCAWP